MSNIIWHLQVHFYIWVKSVVRQSEERSGTQVATEIERLVMVIFDPDNHWPFSQMAVISVKQEVCSHLQVKRRRK